MKNIKCETNVCLILARDYKRKDIKSGEKSYDKKPDAHDACYEYIKSLNSIQLLNLFYDRYLA